MKRETIITVCLCSFLLGLGCHTYQRTVRTVPPPPKLPVVTSVTTAQRERVEAMAVVVPPTPLRQALMWDCGCGQPMPHLGHEFDVQRKGTLTNAWTPFLRTNKPPVIITNGYYRVGCHLGNWL